MFLAKSYCDIGNSQSSSINGSYIFSEIKAID